MKYLEVGAFDGITHSNTLVLNEKLGWDGILVEPIEEYFQLQNSIHLCFPLWLHL